MLPGGEWVPRPINPERKSLFRSPFLLTFYYACDKMYSLITSHKRKERKMQKAVLFDLDGTLLPLDQDFFVKTYLGRLAAYLALYGYNPDVLIKAIMKGTDAMIANDGEKSNEEVFWDTFEAVYDEDKRQDAPYFESFYKTDFEKIKSIMGFDERARGIVAALKEQGIITVLATNPVFPAVATEARMRWAGLTPDLFDLVTTYENIGYCKPNPEYYREILRRLNLSPENCVMVGNDVDDDMIAEVLGMRVFLLTDRLVNRRGADISRYPQGGFADLAEFLGVKL